MFENLTSGHGTPVHQAFVENAMWDDGSEDTEEVKEDMDVKGLKVANLVKPFGKVPTGKQEASLIPEFYSGTDQQHYIYMQTWICVISVEIENTYCGLTLIDAVLSVWKRIVTGGGIATS